MDETDETIEFDVEKVKHETSKAILVEIEGDEHWVPKSQISDDSEVFSREHGEGTLIVSQWWAEQEGLV